MKKRNVAFVVIAGLSFLALLGCQTDAYFGNDHLGKRFVPCEVQQAP